MNFPIVGIGASAGGLDALETFLKSLPSSTGFGFVIILHLDPTKESTMAELLGRFTGMPVSVGTNGLQIQPNSVYVIPSNTFMSIKGRTLFLSKSIKARGLRLPIDFFLESLARDLKEESIGILFSGMGKDGSEGLSAIKESKGIVIIQSPKTCLYDSMPLNAIQKVTEPLVDCIGSPQKIGESLSQLVLERRKEDTETETENHTFAIDPKSLEILHEKLLKKTGHDFSNYKSSTLFRRVERRMNLHLQGTISDYLQFINSNPGEIDLLFKELLIGVTQFFRDPDVWQFFKTDVLPEIANVAVGDKMIRIWVPGCSTGEEAYTIAISCMEFLDQLEQSSELKIQIFATDLDEDAIKKARMGIFSEYEMKDLSAERREKFFVSVDSKFQIIQKVRETIVFAPQSLIRDPPFTKLDLISCRNILIYLDVTLQKKLYRLFHYCLKPGGYLLLGSAETIGEKNFSFQSVEPKLRWYRKRLENVKSEPIDFSASISGYPMNRSTSIDSVTSNMKSIVDQHLLQKFSPTSILTNEKADILYMTGNTTAFLEPTAGKTAMNLLAMVRSEIRKEVIIAFKSVLTTKQTIALKNLKIESSNSVYVFDLNIQSIEFGEPPKEAVLFIFNEIPTRILLPSKKTNNSKSKKNSNITLVEAELIRTREELQLTLEEMQTSQEELKSMNEELQSTNEEMQSTNEELKSSKEELQSLNEELQSVNNELQSKIDDYVAITNDFKNLLDSTNIATLFLGKDLKIKRFTRQIETIFHLIAGDIGRPFTDIVHDLVYPDLETDALKVLENLAFIEKSIPTKDGISWFSVKIMPYRTLDDRINGLVLTFTNITNNKELEFRLVKTNESLDENLKEVNQLLIEKNLILKEVHHRIKNNMAMIQALLTLQAEDVIDPAGREVLLDAGSRIQSMMILYDKLYHSEKLVSFSIKEYIPALAEEIMNIFPQRINITLEYNIEDIVCSPEILSPLGIIINELITNAVKYAFPGSRSGNILIEIIRKGDQVQMFFADDGVGIVDSQAKDTSQRFGLQLIRMLTQQLKGILATESRNGTRFWIEFPMENQTTRLGERQES